jgi:hypothetical protein
VRGAYKMLGREGENNNYLLRWVCVHPKTAWMASSWTGALVATSSLWPIPWASHCAFVCFALLVVIFCFHFNPFYFLLLFPCRVFFLYLFTYSLVDFLSVSMPNPYKPYVRVANLPQKVLPTFELSSCKGAL